MLDTKQNIRNKDVSQFSCIKVRIPIFYIFLFFHIERVRNIYVYNVREHNAHVRVRNH